MSKILNVGIIGCGEAAQILHIPTLQELPNLFKIAALCDVSPTVLAGVGARCQGSQLFSDPNDLLDEASVDLVVIANPNAYHAPLAIEAMNRGKHVLIEKPMCMTLPEADALAEAEARTGMIVQIGYMRRHAPALEEAADLVKGMKDKINFARAHAFIGLNPLFIEPTSYVIRGTDVPQSVIDRTRELTREKLTEALGQMGEARSSVYSLLLGLSSHDISALRELIGMPKSVLAAAHRRGGRYITASFDYDQFICHFETGIDSIARFDAHLEVYSPDQVVRVDYDTPYIRHQPARLTVTESKDKFGVSATQSHVTRSDSFVIEWQRFHDAVTGLSRPKTTIADARLDLEIFSQMMAKM